MSGFWKQMDRRSSISAYNYNLGDEAKAEHIDFTKSNHYYALEVKKLDVGDSVFIKSSNDSKWCFAKLVEKSTDEDGNVYTYQIGQNHKFISLREDQLGECVRLVEVLCRRASFSKVDINQSLSCESYTDRIALCKRQKKLSSQTGSVDGKSNSAGNGDDKENVPHTNNCDDATKSIAVSELSMASPVENVLKQRRSLGAAQQLGDSTSSQPRIPKSISTRSALKQQQTPLAQMNSIEEQHEEEVSHILDDLLKSESLMTEDQSKDRIQRSTSKQFPTCQKSVSSTHRSSLPAYSSWRNHSAACTTRRKSLAVESRSNYQSRMSAESVKPRPLNIDGYKTCKKQEKVDSAQPNTNNFNGATWKAKSDPEIVFTPSPDTSNNFNTNDWRAKSDPDIVFMPSSEEKSAVESDKASNFNTADWRAKSDPEIVFKPSEEEENIDQENHDQKSGRKENTSSTSTALVLLPSSKQNTSNPKPDDSTGEQCSMNEQTEGKKRRRNIFRGRTFFAKKFRKNSSSKKTGHNSKTVTDCKGTKAANESTSENIKRPPGPSVYPNVGQTKYHYHTSSGPSVHPTVGQTNYHTRPNHSSHTATAGFVPNYYPHQNVYYVSDPRLAQAYRDYAHHAMRAQATQCVYNQSTFAQFNNQMTGHAGLTGLPPSMQPTSIRVGTNGITGANYRMTSVGHGVQIGVPNSSNIMYINL